MNSRTVLITGCSAGGIGSALAEAFQKRGFHVFATARDVSKMAHLNGLPNVTLIQLDITSAASIASAFRVIESRTGGTLDYLVNNAGRRLTAPALDTNIEEGRKLFDVNFWGVLAMTHTFAPLVISAQGSIVNICSIAGHICQPWTSLYSASKAAVEMLSETMRLEMVPLGVNVISVVTGAVDTRVFSNTPPIQLPSGSRYKAVETYITSAAKGEGVSAMDPNLYAEKVVSDVLGGASGRTWRGKVASMIRFASPILPSFITDKIMIAGTGLDAFPRAQGRAD